MATSSSALRNRLKLKQLVLLAELKAAGSLHKAADSLGMSQPAATRLVHELEELMGASLFERTNRGMVPTDMGRLLMQHAAVVLTGIDHVYQEASALRSGNAGALRVGTSPGAPAAMIGAALIKLKRETPRMSVKLIQGDNEALLEGLRDGGLDLVVGRAPTGSGKEAFDFELLYTEHFSVIGAATTPSSGEPVGIESLVSLPWVLPLPTTALRSNLELMFLSHCGHLPDDYIEAAISPVTEYLVTAGQRITVVPSWLARELELSGNAHMLIPRLPNITGPIGMTCRSIEPASCQMSRLYEALRVASASLAPATVAQPKRARSPTRR